jgi:hypothetical protein
MYAAVDESPPTWMPPTVTPSGISFGFECRLGGRGVVVVVVVVVVSVVVVSGAVVVASVVVVVSVDGAGDCAPPIGAIAARTPVPATASRHIPITSGRFKGSQCTARSGRDHS